jgi:type II secretory pathway pseudopilin PulG
MAESSPPPLEHSFTLIELLVVVATMTILAALAVPVFNSTIERAKATKDLSNLRQIGAATQMYMNDNNGVLFSTGSSWMTQVNPKYISRWAVLQSPFDKRPGSEAGTTSPVSPISYGINANVFSGSSPFSADRITKPSSFILFAPAQKSGTTVSFQGTAVVTLPVVTVLGIGGNSAASNPGGTATGGTYNKRAKINALFGDLHSETMSWATFTNNAATSNDPDGLYRWTP